MTGGEHTTETTWPGGIAAITLFVEDLESCEGSSTKTSSACRSMFEDADSAVFDVRRHARQPAPSERGAQPDRPGHRVAAAGRPVSASSSRWASPTSTRRASGSENAVCKLLNGPMDRPWGIRTASFRDPGGHIWEIAQN